jgi:hypothetical protein
LPHERIYGLPMLPSRRADFHRVWRTFPLRPCRFRLRLAVLSLTTPEAALIAVAGLMRLEKAAA